MMAASLFERSWRAAAFARHVPLSKLLRRLELDLRRRLRDRMPGLARLSAVTPTRKAVLPSPLFAPRAALAPTRAAAGWRFEFLHLAVEMSGPGIDWQAPGPGAANQLWRMNLHYMEYLEGLDDNACVACVEDWIAANPPERPGVWRDSWNSYALSLRVVVWLQEMARRAPALLENVRLHIESSVASQLLFLEDNLETDLGGNHLIKNIKALLWASACFEGSDAERWRRLGLNLLERELDAQILADGAHYERSPSYHCQVFADLLECRHALGADPLNGALDDALRRMAQATIDFAHPDGGVALFNDAGVRMAYGPGECLGAYARIYGERPSSRRVFAFRDAGYFGLRGDDGAYLLVDCGRIAPDDLPAHGHGDVLSFEWSVAGEQIVVDQGVFEYITSEKRAASRAAMSHNTLCFEGADQADFFGSFRCGRRPNVEVRRWEPCPEGFVLEGAHDGFSYLAGAPRHIRRFEARCSSIDIVDRIEGRTNDATRLNFLLHPDVFATRRDEEIELSRSGLKIAFSSSSPCNLEPAVWWPDMGEERDSTRIVVRVPAGHDEIRTSFRIISGDSRA